MSFRRVRPNPRELTLKVGAQVVFCEERRRAALGQRHIGRVYMASDDTLIVETEDGEKHHAEPAVENVRHYYDEKEKKVKEDVRGTFTQYPVQLAYPSPSTKARA